MSMKPTLCNYGITYLIIIFCSCFPQKEQPKLPKQTSSAKIRTPSLRQGPYLQIPTVIQHAIGKQATDMCASGTNSCLVM